jgi:hypothetical protein
MEEMNQQPLLMNQDQPEQLPENQGQQSGLSFTAQQIEDGLREQFEGDELDDLGQLVNAGHKLIFGKDTHYQILDGFKATEGEQLAMELAQGAVGLTGIIMQESGGSVPPQLIGSAATILMARVSEFLNESGMANVTDEVFEEAMHAYSVKLMADNDPEFARQAGGMQQEQPMQQPAQQQPPAQPGGLLNRGGV